MSAISKERLCRTDESNNHSDIVLSLIANLHKYDSLQQIKSLLLQAHAPFEHYFDLFVNKLQQKLKQTYLNMMYDLQNQLNIFNPESCSVLLSKLQSPDFFRKLNGYLRAFNALSVQLQEQCPKADKRSKKKVEAKVNKSSDIFVRLVAKSDQSQNQIMKRQFPRRQFKVDCKKTISYLIQQLQLKWNIKKPYFIELYSRTVRDMSEPLNPFLLVQDLFVSFGRPVDRAINLLYEVKTNLKKGKINYVAPQPAANQPVFQQPSKRKMQESNRSYRWDNSMRMNQFNSMLFDQSHFPNEKSALCELNECNNIIDKVISQFPN